MLRCIPVIAACVAALALSALPHRLLAALFTVSALGRQRQPRLGHVLR